MLVQSGVVFYGLAVTFEKQNKNNRSKLVKARIIKQYFSYFIPFFAPQIRSWTWEARLLNWLTCVWLIIGLVTLVSASYPESIVNHNDGLYILKRQQQ